MQMESEAKQINDVQILHVVLCNIMLNFVKVPLQRKNF